MGFMVVGVVVAEMVSRQAGSEVGRKWYRRRRLGERMLRWYGQKVTTLSLRSVSHVRYRHKVARQEERAAHGAAAQQQRQRQPSTPTKPTSDNVLPYSARGGSGSGAGNGSGKAGPPCGSSQRQGAATEQSM